MEGTPYLYRHLLSGCLFWSFFCGIRWRIRSQLFSKRATKDSDFIATKLNFQELIDDLIVQRTSFVFWIRDFSRSRWTRFNSTCGPTTVSIKVHSPVLNHTNYTEDQNFKILMLNIFTRSLFWFVCLLFCAGPQPWSPHPPTPLNPMPTCSTCCCSTWTSLYKDPSSNIFKLVHYEAGTVGKQAVVILLECFLVLLFFCHPIGMLSRIAVLSCIAALEIVQHNHNIRCSRKIAPWPALSGPSALCAKWYSGGVKLQPNVY